MDDENVSISAGKKILNANYVNMGFLDRRHNAPRPNQDWLLLKLLAKLYGELATDDRERNDKYKKQKQTLSSSLQYYFSIADDPFYPYKDYIPNISKKSNSYKTRLTLIYPVTEKSKEIKSFLCPTNDMTPQDEFNEELDEFIDEEKNRK